ncbi:MULTISPECIES: iron-siderophore ABC transporter substrate-binding protein [unclassified Curtobacterium]|uniref:iron-siderophore ABC transporter substrate-binding protein n=1 Tax=unclassified Curtobacterium TaxID=257496 RepID=UPI00226B48F7|nr:MULTISPECIES: iron-siderophore ABC transporter substrate-binding protein [unclassified Curtobacterium]
MRPLRPVAVAAAAVAVLLTAACSSTTPAAEGTSSASADGAFPVTIEHALGTTTIDAEPKRVATVQWENQEVPLALGIVPVGMARADFGDDDGDGVLPWVADKLEELDAKTPVLFDETDGIDFEAVADTNPDVILAPYSGLTKDDYETLSEIAPTVAYPEAAWATNWRESIEMSSEALGLEDRGDDLVDGIEDDIEAAVAKHPQLEGKSTMFLTHVDTSDLSEVSFYTTKDTRALFFEDLGLEAPESIAEASKGKEFSKTISAEKVDTFDDVDMIVTYGDDSLVTTLESDPLLSKMPAVANNAIVALPSDDPIGTAANPTPLAISWVLEDYVQMLADAADKADADSADAS